VQPATIAPLPFRPALLTGLLAVFFLLAHLPLLPPTLEDVDSINFALGARDFDVARHQPHPPGYPVFIALAKVSTAAMTAAGVPAPEPRGLAIWSAILGAALIPLLFGFFRTISDDASSAAGAPRAGSSGDRRAWWATLVVAGAPLFWFTALRPLSDTAGLAFVVGAQALLAAVIVGRRGSDALPVAAFLATLAIGVRSQSFVLTLPLLLWALVLPGTTIAVRHRAIALGAALAGGLAWAVPLVIASGGPSAYLAALGTQAGEDFSGVVILWTMRSPRLAAQALIHTFLWPWGPPWLGGIVIAIAAAGAVAVLGRSPRAAVLLAAAFVPYAAFHLLFHETATVRYALPLVVPVAFLFVMVFDRGPRLLLPVVASLLAAAGVVQSARPSWIYGRDGSPAFRALSDVRALPTGTDGTPRALGLHAFARRAAEWSAADLGRRVLSARHGVEWLPVVEELRRTPAALFLADPRRTDLALFDIHALTLLASHRWGFVEPPFVGGARPGNADLYRIDSPGWMLDRGWALSAEIGGVTDRSGAGPHRQPSVAWIRSREEAALALVGGRHLGAAGEPAAEITVAMGERVVARWTAAPGFFVKRFELPPAALAHPDRYAPLRVTSRAADGSAREVRVALEQFDLQGTGVPMFSFEEGWQEPEYNPQTAIAWRWMSDRAVLWVRPIGRDVTLEVVGESPLRYYDAAPVLRVAVGDTPVTEFRPDADFEQSIRLGAAALSIADGRVVLTSDRSFVPGERDGSADRRRLGLRMYGVRVR
jgi:hypothetical protein